MYFGQVFATRTSTRDGKKMLKKDSHSLKLFFSCDENDFTFLCLFQEKKMKSRAEKWEKYFITWTTWSVSTYFEHGDESPAKNA